MRTFLCCLFIAGLPALGGDWSGFRGENAAGVAEGYELPTQIDPAGGYLFKTALPPGSSSPAVTGDRIYLTGYEGERLITLALDRGSGKILWRREIVRPRDEVRHMLNNAAASSPATDGENVYVFFSDFGLVSYGPDGEQRWRRRLGPFINLHGMAASPVVSGSRLFLICDQDVGAYVVALDKDSGETVWKTERPGAVHGFATPTVFTPEDDVAQLIVPGSYQVTSYELATGKKLWQVHGVTWQIKTTAVVDDDTVYVSAWAPGADAGQRRFFPPYDEVIAVGDRDGDGKLLPDEIPEEMRHTGSWKAIDLDADGYMDARDWGFYRARWSSRNVTLAIEPAGARGDLTDSHVVWEYERAVPVVSSPLLYRGLLYTIKDGGILTVFDAETGEVRHQGRLAGAIDKYYASPVAGDGKVYLASEAGKLSVIGGHTGWEPLAVADFGEPIYATPAISNGALVVRTAEALYAFE